MDEGRKNRLANEMSPYLLQHAGNPVYWFPWGEEAFAKAARLDKPIFLSVGYSTCHWCHVMAHESFEDHQTAGLLNEAFICVKVDREERPDVDRAYMTACQVMTGTGGWPLTVVMAPGGEPFFAATYIPREGRFSQMGLRDLVPKISEAWRLRREELLRAAARIVAAVNREQVLQKNGKPSQAILDEGFSNLTTLFDKKHGGFSAAPKFPMPHQLLFLLRYGRRRGRSEAGQMAETTLQAMRQGGIYDQIGFGFHRYSTDDRWLVPHFEKMLYDQALLAMAYLEAFEDTQKKSYAETAMEIFTYVLRDMTDRDGGFFTAEDADSEGGEGVFYLWRDHQIEEVLGAKLAHLARKIFSVSSGGNFVPESARGLTGLNILHLTGSPSETADKIGLTEGDLGKQMEVIRERLFAARTLRARPFLDDKILTDWNGLMIASLAMGARVLGGHRLADAACRAVDFLFSHLRDHRGGLLHCFRNGKAAISAFLDDYAFLIWGLIECHRAGVAREPLQWAVALQEHQDKLFRDPERGCYYMTASDVPVVLSRQVEIHDGAVPSGNAVSLWNLVRLSHLTGDSTWTDRAVRLAGALSSSVRRAPTAHALCLIALDDLLNA
jgi:hypothetical protein